MNSRNASIYLAILLTMLAGLMASHLLLLHTGLRECDAYQRILLERLKVSKIGSADAIAIRKEVAEYLSGKTSECAELESVYQEASDKYVSVILALLTGSGIATGVAIGRAKPP